MEDVLARGLLTTALALTDRCPPSAWPEGMTTVGELFRHFGEQLDLSVDVDAVVEREARMLSAVARSRPHCGSGVSGWVAAMEEALARPLDRGALGEREVVGASDVSLRELRSRADELHHMVDWLHREVAARDVEIARLRTENAG